jgi:hypothetical protein
MRTHWLNTLHSRKLGCLIFNLKLNGRYLRQARNKQIRPRFLLQTTFLIYIKPFMYYLGYFYFMFHQTFFCCQSGVAISDCPPYLYVLSTLHIGFTARQFESGIIEIEYYPTFGHIYPNNVEHYVTELIRISNITIISSN